MKEECESLREKLIEAQRLISILESRPASTVEVVKYIELPERVVEREVKVPVSQTSYTRVEVDKIVYADNPDHIETIRKLQERVAELTSRLE